MDLLPLVHENGYFYDSKYKIYTFNTVLENIIFDIQPSDETLHL